MENYSLVRLLALMDQEQARRREGQRRYQNLATARGREGWVRGVFLIIIIISLNVTGMMNHNADGNKDLVALVAFIGLLVLCSTFLISFPAKIAWRNFLKDDERYHINTWGTERHPEVKFYWDESVNLYAVIVGESGSYQHLGYVTEDSCFLQDFTDLM